MTGTMIRMVAVALPLAFAGASAQSMPGSDAAGQAGFGTAVAALDGVVFVGEGANVMRPGIVYVYRPAGDGWTESRQLTAPDAAAGDGFGRALAAAPGLLLVSQGSSGADGRVHIFERSGRQWAHAGVLTPDSLPEGARFGASLAVTDGLLAVGATGVAEGAGRVYVFERTRSGWSQAGTVSAPEGQAGDGFGSAIALDGTRLAVGAAGRAEGAGVAFVFRQDPGTGEWRVEGTLSGSGVERRAGFGAGITLAGDRAMVAAPGFANAEGAVFEFGFDGADESWGETARLRPFDGSRFTRFGAAMVSRGETLYVGAPGSGSTGAIYAMRRGPEGGWMSAEKLIAEQVEDGAGFGGSLAIAGDVAVAGATGVDYGAGAAVILGLEDGEWRGVSRVLSEPESLAALTGREDRCEGGTAADQFDCADVDLQSFLPVQDIGGARGVRLNDIWGWVDAETGREYALVGRIDGTSFVDITDASNPRYLGDLPKTEEARVATWRDIKVYGHHAFIVADGAGPHGMQVFDLTRLRNVDEPVTFDVDAHYDGIASAHNIVVDTASGFAFAVGARGGGETCGGGLHMIDVRTPTRPEFAGCFADPQTGRASTGYSHDAQCVTYEGPDEAYSGRQICLGANETALSIADVTDKGSPVAVARASYPNVGYTHQGWLTPDQRYFYMNDELDELQGKTTMTRTLIWDVSDLDDPILAGEFMGATEATDHNLYIRGNLMYQSNYQAGLRIIDISDPENPREIGYFDTVPYGENTAGFGGSWSNYPYFPSGTVIVTSGREGLFILKKREPVS